MPITISVDASLHQSKQSINQSIHHRCKKTRRTERYISYSSLTQRTICPVHLLGRYVPAGNTGTKAAIGASPRSATMCCVKSRNRHYSGQLALLLNRHYSGPKDFENKRTHFRTPTTLVTRTFSSRLPASATTLVLTLIVLPRIFAIAGLRWSWLGPQNNVSLAQTRLYSLERPHCNASRCSNTVSASS